MPEIAVFPLPFHVGRKVSVMPVRTLRELEMMHLSAVIREKPAWQVKINVAGIVGRWTQEATEFGMTEAQIRYVLAELAYYAERRDERTGIEVSSVDGVWQSDALIDDELRSRLREAVRVLEDVPGAERDWHPGSDEQVLDLVHPSLFCLVRGVSRPDDSTWPSLGPDEARYALSGKFQWLPTDVEVSENGDAVFLSYVNNLHPVAHRELASILPVLFGRMLPLFENVLTDLRHPRPVRIRADANSWYVDEPVLPRNGDDDAFEAWGAAWDDWRRNRSPVPPDAPAFTPPDRRRRHEPGARLGRDSCRPRPGIPEHPPASRRPVPPRGPLPAGTSQDSCVLPARSLGDDHLDIRRAATAALVSDVDHDNGASEGVSQPTDAGAEALRR